MAGRPKRILLGRTVALRPVAATFSLFGAFWGGWAVAAVDLERALRLSHAGYGLLLAAALAGAAGANAVGGALAERRGTAPVLSAALAAWAGLLVASALARAPGLLTAALVLTVVAGGLVDVAMNVAATAALAGSPGELVRFHARFNAGAAIGAGAMGVLLASGASWRWGWLAAGTGAAALVAVCGRATLPASGPGEPIRFLDTVGVLRREALVLVAIAFGAGAMVEGGVDLWGVLYLRTHLSAGLAIGATSAVVGYLIATVTRVVLGPAAGRRGPGAGVAAGAGTAAAGVVLLAFAPTWLAGAGLVLAAGGVSLCWPLLLAQAGTGRDRPAAIVGSVSAVGYIGLVLGPAMVGWVAAAAGLRAGLLLLAAAALFVAVTPMLSARRGARHGSTESRPVRAGAESAVPVTGGERSPQDGSTS